MEENDSTNTIVLKENDIGKKLSGKYLTFILGQEEYGIQILKVREIIRIQKITPIPKTPDFIRGIINLRGKIVPVVNLHLKFGMNPKDDNEKTCIVVVQLECMNTSIIMGIVIDDVKEVLDIEPEFIEDVPAFGVGVDIDYIMGIAKINENVKMLLNVEKVLSVDELEDISKISKQRTTDE